MKPFRRTIDGALPVSDQNSTVVLAANTVETVDIPAGARVMVLQATVATAFLFDADPPNVADNVDGDGGMLVTPGVFLPIDLPLPLPTNVRLNSAGAATVGVSFYGAP